jgi:HEPN domain-containing protein
MAGMRHAEARRWWQQASYDLQAVRWNIQGGFHDTALAQQASAKALKSLLYYLGARRIALLTHSLVDMVQEGQARVSALTGLLDDARELDLHSIPSRYPNGLPSGYPHQFSGEGLATRALSAAENIITVVQDYDRAQGADEILAPEADYRLKSDG